MRRIVVLNKAPGLVNLVVVVMDMCAFDDDNDDDDVCRVVVVVVAVAVILVFRYEVSLLPTDKVSER